MTGEAPTAVSPQTHPYSTKQVEILRNKIMCVTADRKRNRRPPTTFLSDAIRLFQPKLLQQEVSRLCFACGALNVTRALDLIAAGVPINADADANFGHGPLMAVIRSGSRDRNSSSARART
ncbi:hypothetical protein C8034_v003934 [Colletotrichum sidae]|uniref:Uncharacterized protein n=1 Tax=Colletotrichum sidae TaxID=1347389 RepID=A0A4V3I3W4_9PEZI|nr:hypothetical protein C8034_v003934 [Colletotrichum sidae]